MIESEEDLSAAISDLSAAQCQALHSPFHLISVQRGARHLHHHSVSFFASYTPPYTLHPSSILFLPIFLPFPFSFPSSIPLSSFFHPSSIPHGCTRPTSLYIPLHASTPLYTLQERAAQQAAGTTVGEAMLFFGCRRSDVDFIYKDEILAWAESGVITDLVTAFSREGPNKVLAEL